MGDTTHSTIVGACSICFEPLSADKEAFVETCLHHFCFDCITKWASLQSVQCHSQGHTARCPVCMTEFTSVIYDCHDDFSYRKWSLLAHAVPVSNENYIRDYPSRPENFCLTAAHRRRRCLYLTADTSNSTDTASTQECPPIKSMSIVFRPSVYKWLERELQALLCHEDVNLLVQHVMGSLERSRLLAGRPLHQVSAETGSKICDLVQQVVEPVFVQLNRQSDWSRRLAIEFVNFVASGLTVDAYDEAKEQQEVYEANCCEEEQP